MIKNCKHCGKEFDGHGNAKYCPDCRRKIQLEHQRRHYSANHVSPAKNCARCEKEFTGRGKYCPDCKKIVQREQQRLCNRRYRENHRKQRPKPVAKPVEKIRPLTKDDLHQLLTLIRDAYQAGWLILTFGGQSALTDEQLAVVEQKYPEHRQTLGDQRSQKFFDAADKFIELYQSFK